jgi:hypothetical protein
MGWRKGLREVMQADMRHNSRAASVRILAMMLVMVGSEFSDGER